jgi:phosphopantetheinyl transferase
VVVGAPVFVSISHREGHAVAVAATAPVGVDLEGIEPRSAAFQAEWLTAREREACGGEPLRVNLCWAAKEAVLKWLGTGLRGQALEVEVTGFGDRALHGDVRTLALARGADELAVTWAREGDEVVVIARAPEARAA